MDDNIDRNKRLIRAYTDAINSYNWDQLDNIVSDGFVRHSFAAGEPSVKCRGDLIQFLRTQHKIFPNFEDQILDLIAEGDRVAARHCFRGTQLGEMGAYPISHKEVNLEYLAIYRCLRPNRTCLTPVIKKNSVTASLIHFVSVKNNSILNS